MKIKRIYLEITNACNLDCPFCTNKKGQSFMSIDTIYNYLEQIKEFSDYVYLHVLGEPLLHSNIDAILEKCDELNLNVQLVTNGTLLDSNLSIFKHKSLRKLSISIHSLNYTNISSNYFETIKKIIDLDIKTSIELRFYDFNNLKDEIKKFKDYLFDKYDIKETKKLNSYKLKENVYIYTSELFDWPDIKDNLISDIGSCRGAIDQIAILNNGIVTICCLDPNGYNAIGNLKTETLSDILNSNKYKEVIQNFKNKKLTFELCKKCSYRLRFDDMHNLKQLN